jgi:hypothetical protein
VHAAPKPLSGRHEQTRRAIFEEPTWANVLWNDVVGLLGALGATARASGGSMYAFALRGRRIVLHRPHLGSDLVKGAVEAGPAKVKPGAKEAARKR